jgi:NAD(P)-dependent dehydrogenase (short-subunit alcohol dehydrogenase family)
VTDERSVADVVAGAVDRFGRLDIAFNNAGMQSYGPIEQLDVDEFDRVMATNVRGVWLLLKHELSAMRAAGNGGAIVNTSSIAATGATAGLSAYAPSKAAVDAMTRVLALEAGTHGIRVNNVSPGLTRTPMNEGLPDSLFSAVAAHAALKRIAEPEDIADVAVWLCTDEARFVTGQSVLVDGGFNLAGVR